MSGILKVNFHRFCSNKLSNQQLKENALKLFGHKNSVISFSKYLEEQKWPLQFPNCYMHEGTASQMKINPQQDENPQNNPPIQNSNVFRILINTGIGTQEITTDINRLKKNIILKRILKMQNTLQYKTKVSNVIIDDQIAPTIKQKSQIDQYIAKVSKNMMEIEKMIEIGLELKYAYLISNKNYACKEWVKLLNKKRKAIHSNIVFEMQSNKFEEFVYDEGYKLQHIFLNAYKIVDGKVESCGKLQEATAYSLQQICNILKMISFDGKIILEDNEYFGQNLIYLQNLLKKNGYSQQTKQENWFARI